MRPFVLASTSRYRRALLDQLGLAYQAAPPRYEEDHSLPLTAEQMVVRFARGKAESLAEQYPNALLVGSDQLAALDDTVLTKPGSAERAVEQLMTLAGRSHRLLTAVALHVPPSHTSHRLVTTRMTMRPLTAALARAYVEHDRPIDCAGSYRVESLGPTLFDSMDGPDHTAIVGLAVTAVASLLAEVGEDLLARCVAAPS